MIIYTISGKIDTNELFGNESSNLEKLEESSRKGIEDAILYPIGYVIPLGTLGNAQVDKEQFMSNFHIVLYSIADGLIDKKKDFEDFNIENKQSEQGQIYKVMKRLQEIVKGLLGDNWRITLFNVSVGTAIDSMCRELGNSGVEGLAASLQKFEGIVTSRLKLISMTSEDNPWKHEVVELFYTPIKVISYNFTKHIESNICNGLKIETLVYDEYANGLRLLDNIEYFTSTKIRQHNSDNNIYSYVLKARVYGADTRYKPIRQFAGKSKLSNYKIQSGCTERIIYNIVNKNYKHWSFMSIPSSLGIDKLC